MDIAALVSGGVDSSVALHLLKEQGYTPDIYYIRIGMEDTDGFVDCPAEEDIEITQWLAHHYGCRFEQVDLHREYWDNVVSYTIDSVRRGLTPNPDVMCNKLIKFGAFNQRYGINYDRIATGHYARTETLSLPMAERSVSFLATAVDPIKDQTDFLSQLTYPQIEKLLFPIGHLMKSEVRAIAHQAGLPSADRKDSQGICFLGKINYNDFLRRYLGEREGDIVELETGRVLGHHRGYWFHTIGQRKGLYLGGGPWFVVQKDMERNILYVSQGYDPDAQYGTEIPLADFHYLSAPIWETQPSSANQLATPEGLPIRFKIRHTPEFLSGRLVRSYGTENSSENIVTDSAPQPYRYTILSDTRVQGIAPGQYATLYDTDCHLVVAAGQISQ